MDDDRFGYLIFMLNKNHHKYLDTRFKELNLNLTQGLILLKLFEFPDTSQKEMGECFELSKGTVAKYLIDLEDKGLVIRQRIEGNKRKYDISLSDKALELIPELDSISKDWNSKVGLNTLGEDFYKDFILLVGNSGKILEDKT